VTEALRAFDDWMNGSGPLVFIGGAALATLLGPLVVLVHELGHATVGLVGTEGMVRVRVGRSPAHWRIRLGRLNLDLSPFPAKADTDGLATVYGRLGLGGKVAFGLAGPLASTAAAGAILLGGVHGRSTVIEIAGAILLVSSLLSFVPHERHGRRSDGAYLVDAVRSRHSGRGAQQSPLEPALSETYERWLALFTNPEKRVKTEQRSRLLAAAPIALGYQLDDPGPIPRTLFQLAVAGWCWREAEASRPDRLRRAIFDAVRSVEADVDEPTRWVRTAAKLAGGDVELSLASPDANDAERRAFLRTAFLRLPASLRPAAIPEPHRLFAWRYGLALHDVEFVRDNAETSARG
jgi:hypothetical protein